MIIGLITDYGYKDPYVGVMKAVIKSINPRVEVIDITHGVEKFNVLEAAVTLLVSSKYFPRGTIFVTVVDPGVGSDRKALLIETKNFILIGPDNGCLTLLADRDGVKRVFDISNSKYRLSKVSYTFHGRDIFAPVAAWVSLGSPIDDVGVEIGYGDVVKINLPRNEKISSNAVKTHVLYVDVFGNVMTNLSEEEVYSLNISYGDEIEFECRNGVYRCVFERSFSRVPRGALACYVNSWGFLEIAVNMGDASKETGLRVGDYVLIRRAGWV